MTELRGPAPVVRGRLLRLHADGQLVSMTPPPVPTGDGQVVVQVQTRRDAAKFQQRQRSDLRFRSDGSAAARRQRLDQRIRPGILVAAVVAGVLIRVGIGLVEVVAVVWLAHHWADVLGVCALVRLVLAGIARLTGGRHCPKCPGV